MMTHRCTSPHAGPLPAGEKKGKSGLLNLNPLDQIEIPRDTPPAAEDRLHEAPAI